MKKFLCCGGEVEGKEESNMEVIEVPGLPYHVPPMVDITLHVASVRKGSRVIDFHRVSNVQSLKEENILVGRSLTWLNKIQSDEEKERILIAEKPKAEVVAQPNSLPENASQERGIERKTSEFWDISTEESNSNRVQYIVSNEHGDAFYSGSPQCLAKGDAKYEGRVSHNAVVERINEKVYHDKYSLANGLFKIIDNEWKDEIGKVGYIGLANVTEKTGEESIEHYFILQRMHQSEIQETHIPLACGDYTGKGYDEFDLAVHFEADIDKALQLSVDKETIRTALRELEVQGYSLDDLYHAKNGAVLCLPDETQENEGETERTESVAHSPAALSPVARSPEAENSAEYPQSPQAESRVRTLSPPTRASAFRASPYEEHVEETF